MGSHSRIIATDNIFGISCELFSDSPHAESDETETLDTDIATTSSGKWS
jgi:hypothetical protein